MRKYNIIKNSDEFFKVECTDSHGNSTVVYERNILDASKFVMNYWENEDDRQDSKELMHKAMLNMIEIDKKYNITKGNRDGLD